MFTRRLWLGFLISLMMMIMIIKVIVFQIFPLLFIFPGQGLHLGLVFVVELIPEKAD